MTETRPNDNNRLPTDPFRCGFIALVGRTNAGKSTLVNTATGEKVSITSPKPQTTRNRIRAIINMPERAQLIFVDTPGVHAWQKRALNRAMVETAMTAIGDADCTLLLIDATAALTPQGDVDPLEKAIIEEVARAKAKTVLAINKCDLLPHPEALLPIIDAYAKAHEFAKILPLSARDGKGLPALLEALIAQLPHGPALYPEDLYTDQAERFLAAEILREVIIRETQKELPYSVMVQIEDFKEDRAANRIAISAVIHVERPSQKGILIGKGGTKLKAIGIATRQEFERLLGCHIDLRTHVRVAEAWPEDPRSLRRFGYIEE